MVQCLEEGSVEEFQMFVHLEPCTMMNVRAVSLNDKD